LQSGATQREPGTNHLGDIGDGDQDVNKVRQPSAASKTPPTMQLSASVHDNVIILPNWTAPVCMVTGLEGPAQERGLLQGSFPYDKTALESLWTRFWPQLVFCERRTASVDSK